MPRSESESSGLSVLFGLRSVGKILITANVIAAARPTTHDDPVYTVDGVIHYCVANMPGAVPITSTRALTNVTLPYIEQLADLGALEAVRANPELARGVNVIRGKVTYEAVCEAHDMPYTPLDAALAA